MGGKGYGAGLQLAPILNGLEPIVKDDSTRTPTKASGRFGWLVRLVLLLALGLALITLYRLLPDRSAQPSVDLRPTLAALSTELARAQAAASKVPPSPEPSSSPLVAANSEQPEGLVVYSRWTEGYTHLWGLRPGSSHTFALTAGAWNDDDPALGPAGERVAFRSDRDGQWDLYVLDLADGSLRRLTDTEDYEGHPTWSPDGRWLAYEAYHRGDLDIWILPLDGAQPPVQVTNHPALDSSPSWEPAGGRRIAFISARDDSADVYLADLDKPNDRFLNLTQSADWDERDPAFSPDGGTLAYATEAMGVRLIWSLDLASEEYRPQQLGAGVQPVWAPDRGALLALLETPHGQQTVVYDLESGAAPAVNLLQQGARMKIDWGASTRANALQEVASSSAPILADPRTQVPEQGQARMSLIALGSVEAPNPRLLEVADGPFSQLRARTAEAVGWDFLGTLDAAFVGLNDPLPPGFAYNDWLYTGRAFAFQQGAYRAGWVEVVREDFGGQTYWRVFVKTSEQDGSQGQPLSQRPWDFESRYRGDPSDYDQGGRPKESVPAGYYLDFTALAEAYGFERQPALNNWRTFFPGARFNEFAFTEGLDWLTAMRQLYPAEAIATPTPFISPTPTPTLTPWPTPTPWWWRWRTPTPTPPPPPPTVTPFRAP